MKKGIYTTPELEVIEFVTEDVITGSQPQGPWDSMNAQQTSLDEEPWVAPEGE